MNGDKKMKKIFSIYSGWKYGYISTDSALKGIKEIIDEKEDIEGEQP